MLNRGAYLLLSERAEPEEDGTFSAFCDELGLATCANTESAAKARLRKAVLAVLNAATERGEIREYLGNKNVRIYSPSPSQGIDWGRNIIMSGSSFSAGLSITHRPYELAFHEE